MSENRVNAHAQHGRSKASNHRVVEFNCSEGELRHDEAVAIHPDKRVLRREGGRLAEGREGALETVGSNGVYVCARSA